MTYCKQVGEKEYQYTLAAADSHIAPEIVSVSIVPNEINRPYLICSVEYPSTLTDIPLSLRGQYYNSIVDLVQRLHHLGFRHGDISEDNVVINPYTGDVRLIDFGLSEPYEFGDEYNEVEEVAFICGVPNNFSYYNNDDDDDH